eukprot:TRINITY_DN7612_c0_g1_i1.p1 TRINITY_DN7612_c0_g1~~TRINITY_DN7612_c0_g1_i1.p1  ORF type:complete len:263 (+),score=63.54 TRINITY_DN7612_c0_g1_i1:182-970(+)
MRQHDLKTQVRYYTKISPAEHSQILYKKGSLQNISLDQPSKPILKKCMVRNFPQTTISKQLSLQPSSRPVLKEKSVDKPSSLNLMERLIEKAKRELKENEGEGKVLEDWKAETAKWKEFGHNLAESYDKLRQKYAQQAEAEIRNAQIANALKEQVMKLKALLSHSNAENKQLKEKLESYCDTNTNIAGLIKENNELAEENKRLKKDKELLENEKELSNKVIKQLNDKIKVSILSMLEPKSCTHKLKEDGRRECSEEWRCGVL